MPNMCYYAHTEKDKAGNLKPIQYPQHKKRAMTAEKVNLGRRWVAKLLAGAAGTAARLKQLCVSIVCPI